MRSKSDAQKGSLASAELRKASSYFFSPISRNWKQCVDDVATFPFAKTAKIIDNNSMKVKKKHITLELYQALLW